MKEKLVKLSQPNPDNCIDLLKDSIEENFESVVVIGYRNDKQISIKRSASIDFMTLVGAIEVAKHDLLEGDK